MLQSVRLTEQLHGQLNTWIADHYRETLAPADLLDPDLLQETHSACDALNAILQLR